MPGPIVYIDRSVITTSDVTALREGLARLTEFVREREPQLLSYGFVIDEAASTMHVVAVHPDSASLELHLGIGGPEFAKVGAFIELQRIEVFGSPSPSVVDQLRQKATRLGTDAHVVVHELAVGFERLTTLGQ